MPLSTTSTASEGADSIPGVPGKVYRVGYDKDGSLPPLVIEDTEDESDYDPTGLLTPVSINLGHERALQREQERYRREQQDLQSQHAWLQRLQAAWAADSAKGGWHMRTRAGIVRNESDLCGWDELFCHLNDQGKLEATESVRDHIMRQTSPKSDSDFGYGSSDEDEPIADNSARRSSAGRPRKGPKTSRGRIQKSWRAKKQSRRSKDRPPLAAASHVDVT